jgi:hypothetical protein
VPVIFIRFEPHLILSRSKGKNFPLHDGRACEGRGTDSLIRNLGFGGEECSAHSPVALRGSNSRNPLNKRLGVPSSRSGVFEKEKNLASTRNRTPDRLACNQNLTKILPAGTDLFRSCGRTDMAKLFAAFQTGRKTDHRIVKLLI